MAIAECTSSASPSFELYEAETPSPPAISKDVRFLTVCRGNPGTRVRAKSECGIVPPVPMLRVQGQWMEEAGFDIGTRVRVQVTPGRLLFEVETT